MLFNHLKIAWRTLTRHPFISFINLFGLTVGLTCCLLIAMYVEHETSYDRYNANANRIYRVTRSFNNRDGAVTLRLGTVAPPFGPLLQNYFPDIQKVTRLLGNGKTPVKYEEKVFNENKLYWADENIFDVFTIDVTRGNPKKALLYPFTVMLSDETAKKYFGGADPIDKTIRINNQFDLKVTGTYRSFPSNSHIHPEIMVSFNTLKDSAVYGEKNLETNFGNNSFFTYLLLPEHYNTANMEAQFPAFLDSRVHFPGAPPAMKVSAGTQLSLQKLTDIHLRSHLDLEAEENGDISRVYIFSLIALIILAIACINYMNLSTARSALRAKEIGIRKVAGAGKGELIAQFLSESVLVCWISMGLAILAAAALVPWLSDISGISFSFGMLYHWKWILPILIVPFAVGLVSGIYPALFMSSFQPAKTLKGLFTGGNRSISFRKVLVVTQFGISIVLIIATVIVFQQLAYMRNASMGYDKEQVMLLPYNFQDDNSYQSFRNELLAETGVKNMGRSSRIPTGRLLDSRNAAAESGDSVAPVNSEIKALSVDQDFISCYDIQLAAGRNFSRSFSTDTTGFIINEATVKMLNWGTPDKAIGKTFQYGNVKGKIIGVVKDFHFESLHQRIVPMVMALPKPEQNFYNGISVKLEGKNLESSINHVEKAWRKYLPGIPFEFNFMNEKFNQLYLSEQKQGRIFTLFSCLAIFIACLGLLGLSSFAITQRIKEIGIRKVLGASVGGIVMLLSKDFLKLVLIAALIAFPVAWYAMHRWLSDFAYRIDISWWVFAIAAIAAALIALLTVSVQSVKAAVANPVKSLRSE